MDTRLILMYLETNIILCYREEYKTDLAFADAKHAVVIMDFSQNLTLPSFSSTPSQWYFLSLHTNKGIQYNYVYDVTVAGKGTDEVNSILRHFITRVVIPEGHRKLTIYADNCGGQNKNSFVVRMLLALTHMSDLLEIEYKFFVKGHTKNAVDRGFGHVRKRISRADVWTMDQLLEVVTHASASSDLVHIPKENSIFKDYRIVVDEAYKKIKNIQKYQIFSMNENTPGVVMCRKGPETAAVAQDRRKYDGIATESTRNPPLNPEKLQTIYNKVRPFVPDEFRSDPLYDPPNDEEECKAKEIQKARMEASKKRKQKRDTVVTASKAAKRAQDPTPVGCEAIRMTQRDSDNSIENSSKAAEGKTSTRTRKRCREDTA
ncbi:hypothetical protein PHMEG_00015491 [Phytophthora megakarya]|uniref:DUF7869 domain-containing protein n=1 Tax=Phytophthora megakarya TaxID=4795 RepID=A0A225W1N1_9STRA|nr:hypothetical protein PHMEG_00015491 [Phytophthora megakarya]